MWGKGIWPPAFKLGRVFPQSCPLTSTTRVEGGAPTRGGGGGTARADRERAQAPGGLPGGTLGVRDGASKAVGSGPEKLPKGWLQRVIFFERICGKILGGRHA